MINNSSGSAAITFDSNGNAYFSGLVVADRIKANQIEGLEIFTNKLASLDSEFSSMSGSLNSSVLGESTQSANLNSSALNLSSLSVNGLATFSSDTEFKGNSVVDGMLSVLKSVSTPNLLVSDFASFFGDVIFKKNVGFEGRPTFNSDTGGFAVIEKGDDTVSINFDQEYAQTPVVTASIALDQISSRSAQIQLENSILNGNVRYLITNRNTKGFTIKLSQPSSENISFSWVAVSVKDAKTSSSKDSLTSVNPSATSSAAFQSILNQLNNSSGQ